MTVVCRHVQKSPKWLLRAPHPPQCWGKPFRNQQRTCQGCRVNSGVSEPWYVHSCTAGSVPKWHSRFVVHPDTGKSKDTVSKTRASVCSILPWPSRSQGQAPSAAVAELWILIHSHPLHCHLLLLSCPRGGRCVLAAQKKLLQRTCRKTGRKNKSLQFILKTKPPHWRLQASLWEWGQVLPLSLMVMNHGHHYRLNSSRLRASSDIIIPGQDL